MIRNACQWLHCLHRLHPEELHSRFHISLYLHLGQGLQEQVFGTRLMRLGDGSDVRHPAPLLGVKHRNELVVLNLEGMDNNAFSAL